MMRLKRRDAVKLALKLLAWLGMIASAGGAVLAAVFALAAAANASPEQLRGVYLAIGASLALAVFGCAAALMLLKSGRVGYAVFASFAPLPLMVAALFAFLR